MNKKDQKIKAKMLIENLTKEQLIEVLGKMLKRLERIETNYIYQEVVAGNCACF